MDPHFLTLEEVLSIHESRIRLYGGSTGIRDMGLLQSAIGNVEATFDGRFLHETLFEMGASYLYNLCRNHPFIEGNKRTALACALVFLALNGVRIDCRDDEVVDPVVGIASGTASKASVAVFLEEHVE
jgi:death on curing protein